MAKESGEKGFYETWKEIQEENHPKQIELADFPRLSDALDEMAKNARSSTVNPERLVGNKKYFFNVLPFLEEGEQPHYLFPLTRGFTAESALVVESGATQTELLDNSDGGACMITDRYVRVHSSKGEWTIPFESITSVDFVGHPALHIQTQGRTYYIRIAGTLFDEEQNLSDAASYIREKHREAISKESNTGEERPMEKLEKLGELRDKGVVTEEEFQAKKSDLLDEI